MQVDAGVLNQEPCDVGTARQQVNEAKFRLYPVGLQKVDTLLPVGVGDSQIMHHNGWTKRGSCFNLSEHADLAAQRLGCRCLYRIPEDIQTDGNIQGQQRQPDKDEPRQQGCEG